MSAFVEKNSKEENWNLEAAWQVIFLDQLFVDNNLYEGPKKLVQFHGARCLAFLVFETIFITFWQQHAIYKLHVHDVQCTRNYWDVVKVSIFQLFLLYVELFLDYVEVFGKWIFFLQIIAAVNITLIAIWDKI